MATNFNKMTATLLLAGSAGLASVAQAQTPPSGCIGGSCGQDNDANAQAAARAEAIIRDRLLKLNTTTAAIGTGTCGGTTWGVSAAGVVTWSKHEPSDECKRRIAQDSARAVQQYQCGNGLSMSNTAVLASGNKEPSYLVSQYARTGMTVMIGSCDGMQAAAAQVIAADEKCFGKADLFNRCPNPQVATTQVVSALVPDNSAAMAQLQADNADLRTRLESCKTASNSKADQQIRDIKALSLKFKNVRICPSPAKLQVVPAKDDGTTCKGAEVRCLTPDGRDGFVTQTLIPQDVRKQLQVILAQ